MLCYLVFEVFWSVDVMLGWNFWRFRFFFSVLDLNDSFFEESVWSVWMFVSEVLLYVCG